MNGILGVSLSMIWGLAFVAIRRRHRVEPVNLILPWLVSSAVFLMLAPFIGKPKASIKRKHIPRILLVSLLNVAGYHLSLNRPQVRFIS